MTDHALLIRIGDGTGFELDHRLVGGLDAGCHFAEDVILESHAADVDGESQVGVTNKVFLKAVPMAHISC